MAKKAQKAKEPIRIRFKKLSNGNQSIYLDIYRNGQRSYEFLKLYLIPETSPLNRERNAQTMAAANAIKAQRIIELTNSEAGLKDLHRSKMLLSDWFKLYFVQKQGKSKGLQSQFRFTLYLIEQYSGNKIRLNDVDKKFCTGFLDYVSNKYISPKTKQPLSKFTARNYYRCLNSALNAAVRAEILPQNPLGLVEADYKPKLPESKRVYLTIDEVRRLIETDCSHDEIKRAFLFSCFCGLRFSDVARLKWSDLYTSGEQTKVDIRQKKTDEPLYLPLSSEALKWLPERTASNPDEYIFSYFCNGRANYVIAAWAKEAGITKHITFHTARHTFATSLLTLGADLYTTSKLLGHTDIATTQIYAKIIDQKKDEAVNLFNGIF